MTENREHLQPSAHPYLEDLTIVGVDADTLKRYLSGVLAELQKLRLLMEVALFVVVSELTTAQMPSQARSTLNAVLYAAAAAILAWSRYRR
jgi:hypothetical protein